MDNITLPDFKRWAEVLHYNSSTLKDLEIALSMAYDQGYHFGLNRGWQVEQDKEYQDDSAA